MKMSHVTIMTGCLDESVAFYQDAVGLTIQRDMRDDPQHQIVFLGDGAGSTRVELVGVPQGAYSGSGISLGFETDDVQAERAKKEEQGMNPGPIISPNPHARFFFIADPNGVQIQFVQEG